MHGILEVIEHATVEHTRTVGHVQGVDPHEHALIGLLAHLGHRHHCRIKRLARAVHVHAVGRVNLRLARELVDVADHVETIPRIKGRWRAAPVEKQAAPRPAGSGAEVHACLCHDAGHDARRMHVQA